MVMLDTSIVIDHLRQFPEKSLLLKLLGKQRKESVCISILSIQELYEGKSTRTVDREKDFLATVGAFKILPYSYEIAKLAGEIARDLKHPIGFADAAIAATAIINYAQLYTLNTKDFMKIKNLMLYKSETN